MAKINDGVSVIIPSYNGGNLFSKCLSSIRNQNHPHEVDLIVVDSGSTDGSLAVAEKYGARVYSIENKDFHHSETRTSALQYARFEKVVYTVQDAIPISDQWLSMLCSSLEHEELASVSVGQTPHEDADPTARFEVEFHGEYLGAEPRIQSIESSSLFEKLPYDEALHTVRHDNVCAIYRLSLLEKYPFPVVDFAEDMAWAHLMLLRGYKIGYDPRIKVRHSHNRSPEYRFKRYIINSIACAKILGRVKDDITYLKITDLIALARQLENVAISLKQQWIESSESSGIEITTFCFCDHVNKHSSLTLALTHVPEEPCNYIQLAELYCNHIRSVVSMVVDRYSLSSFEEYSYCIDQVTASILGVICGELYSGHMVKGRVPYELETMILPFLRGV